MISKSEEGKQLADELWYWYLTGEHKHDFPNNYERMRSVNRKVDSILPCDPRCFECNLTLSGIGPKLSAFRLTRF